VPELSLEIVEGAGAGRMVTLAGPVTVGRAGDADLVLADELISRHHAQITPSGSGAVVEDLGSRNGTFVNGEAVHGPTHLTPGDQLQLGVTLIELRSATQIAERPSAVHRVPPPLAVPPRSPDYLAGTDLDQGPAPRAAEVAGRDARAAGSTDPRFADPADPRAAVAADPRAAVAADPRAAGGAGAQGLAAPDPVALGPATPGRVRHELDPLLDSRTKGKARTAPLALFVLVALVVIIYLATSR
jgi:pSer/pThr/pTyr-binding forkhead associated (FHA) protein